jgi:hypothetical protein
MMRATRKRQPPCNGHWHWPGRGSSARARRIGQLPVQAIGTGSRCTAERHVSDHDPARRSSWARSGSWQLAPLWRCRCRRRHTGGHSCQTMASGGPLHRGKGGSLLLWDSDLLRWPHLDAAHRAWGTAIVLRRRGGSRSQMIRMPPPERKLTPPRSRGEGISPKVAALAGRRVPHARTHASRIARTNARTTHARTTHACTHAQPQTHTATHTLRTHRKHAFTHARIDRSGIQERPRGTVSASQSPSPVFPPAAGPRLPSPHIQR